MSGRKGAEIRGAGSALPADILKLQPNDSPSWETPRPVRKDGPGGKYRERKVKKKKVSMATRMKAKKEKEERQNLTVEDLQNMLEETKTSLRLAQQLAASRLSDIQFLKAENTKVNIRAKKLNEEVEDLHDTARGAKRKSREISLKLKSKEKTLQKYKRKSEELEEDYSEAHAELKLMEKEFLVLKMERADALSKQTVTAEKMQEIEMETRQQLEEMDARHVSKMSYLTRELEDARRSNLELERRLQKAEAESSALEAATQKMEVEVESHFQQAKEMTKVERQEMKVEKHSWKSAMNKLQQENKELWQQLQFLESALLKGNLNDGMTPENLVLPPVFGMRGTEVQRHERDLQIQKATEIRETKVRELEVQLTEEKSKSELMAGRLNFAEETVHMLMLKNQELEEAVKDAVKTSHQFNDPKLNRIMGNTGKKKSGSPRKVREPKSPERGMGRTGGDGPNKRNRTVRMGGGDGDGMDGVNTTAINESKSGIAKLRQDLEYMREVLFEKGELLATSIAEQKKLSKQLTNQRELALKFEIAERDARRSTARIHAIKTHIHNEHVRLRAALSMYGLFEDAEIPHDKHLNPDDMAHHIHERVDNLLNHAREAWIHDRELGNDQHRTSVVHEAAAALVPEFSVQISKIKPIYYDGRKIKNLNLMVSVFEGENPPHFIFEAYHPPTCGTFSIKCTLKDQRDLLKDAPELMREERYEDRVEALMARLNLIITPGRLELEIVKTPRVEDKIVSLRRWKKRTTQIRASDAQDEFAKLMGMGTQKEELTKMKKDAGMVLPDDTPAYTDTMLFPSKKQTVNDEEQINEMMNVSIIDKLDNDDDKHMIVYCSDAGKETVNYKVRLSSEEIEQKIKGGVDLPRRRLCREIVGRLKVDEKQDLILVDDENMNDKEESNNDVDSDESDTDYDVGEVAKEVAETVFYMIDRDGDGDISRGEMMKAINQIPSMKALIRRNKYLAPLLNPKTWKDTFRAIDVSSDGKISLDEFKNFAVNISLDTKKREDMGEDISINNGEIERIYEGPYKLANGNNVEMTIDQQGSSEIEISCILNDIKANGIFSTEQINSAVPGWERVWRRADNKRKVDLISAGLTITWHIDNKEPLLLMPGSSVQIMKRDHFVIDGEKCRMRLVEHAGKNSKELSRLQIICRFGVNDPPCVANCNSDVQMSIGNYWSEVGLNTTDRDDCIQKICSYLKKLPANTFKWNLFSEDRVFESNGKKMIISIAATVPGADPRLDKIMMEGFDKERSNHMSCEFLKTDESKLRSICKSRKWPEFIKTMIQHLSFDGYTLSFNWDLETPMHSTPANSPLRPNTKKEVKEEEEDKNVSASNGDDSNTTTTDDSNPTANDNGINTSNSESPNLTAVKIGVKIPAPPIVATIDNKDNNHGEKLDVIEDEMKE